MEEIVQENQINITEVVKDTINSLCESLYSSINNTVFPLLDDIVFIDNDITEGSYFEEIFGASINSGVLILANCLLTAFVLYYCARLLFSFVSGNNVDSPYKFILKMVLIAIIMNYSLSVCTALIDCASYICDFFRELGHSILRQKDFIYNFN